MYFLRQGHLEELQEKFTGYVKELYEELLRNHKFYAKDNRKEEKMVLKEKDNEARETSDENFKAKIQNLTDYCSINNAIKAFFAKMKVQKLKFTFTKLIILTDGIGLSFNPRENEQFYENAKYFGLSSLIILIGLFLINSFFILL